MKKIILSLLFLLGFLIMMYPFYINALNTFLDEYRVMNYQKELVKRYEEDKVKWEEENKKMKKTGMMLTSDPFSESTDIKGEKKTRQEHYFGKVIIPKISIDIPLFDITTADLLEEGATVLNGTSYPIGGKGTHAVISAHRGLPNRELFTNLPKLELGDIFMIESAKETIAYEVMEIKVVEPTETSDLAIVPREDFVTLLTCTPYMINTHRLLVKGTRIPYSKEMDKVKEKTRRFVLGKQLLILVGMVVFIVVFSYVIYRKLKNNHPS